VLGLDAHFVIARREVVEVVDTKNEGILGLPGESEGGDAEDVVAHEIKLEFLNQECMLGKQPWGSRNVVAKRMQE
jgi:hypothetical protein